MEIESPFQLFRRISMRTWPSFLLTVSGLAIHLASNAQTLDAGSPIPLFTTHVGGALSFPYKQQYVVSSDGQRFLMNTLTEEEATAPITVILNWKAKP